jgi:hypothetical protein
MKQDSKYPVLLAEMTADHTQYRVWCPFCRTHHYHGAAACGHRVAHCTAEDSPFNVTGYVLRPIRGK